jgi:hypothetical protein
VTLAIRVNPHSDGSKQAVQTFPAHISNSFQVPTLDGHVGDPREMKPTNQNPPSLPRLCSIKSMPSHLISPHCISHSFKLTHPTKEYQKSFQTPNPPCLPQRRQPPRAAEASPRTPNRSPGPIRPVFNSQSAGSPGSSRPGDMLSGSDLGPLSTSPRYSNTLLQRFV